MENNIMSKVEFGRGLQFINAICVNGIEHDSTIDVYYHLLGDLNPIFYLKGIEKLLKEKEFIHNPPSPAEIRKYHNQERDLFLSKNLILEHINRDITQRGRLNEPNYNKKVKLIISKLGGWEYICQNGINLNVFNEELIQLEFKTKLIS